MKYRTHHSTIYVYGEPVSVCHNEVRLTPRNEPRQVLSEYSIEIHPKPESLISRTDYFGNTATFFSIHEPHMRLEIVARSLVELVPRPSNAFAAAPGWEEARERIRQEIQAMQFVFDSAVVQTGDEFRAFAVPSFPPGRSLLEGCSDLCERIHADFTYAPQTTHVDTPVETAFRSRRGVCQDFAHVMIACLRSLGLAARYVSGYLRSGRVGAEASHAWVSVFCPGVGWIDFDPTNNRVPEDEHVTLAWGRDFTDVSPMKGVIVGGGEHLVHVAVGVVEDS